MKALYSAAVSEGPSPFAITLTERPIPELQPNTILIKVRSSGINPSDAANALKNVFKSVKPIIPGRDFAGVVEKASNESLIGTEVYGTSGDSVSLKIDGGHAEYLLVPENAIAPKPKNLSWAQAGVVGVPYTTAMLAIQGARTKAKEDTVMVLGATGASGQAAVSIAKAMGCKVVTTSRRDTTDVNTAKDPEMKKAVELTGGKGPDVVIDSVGSSDMMSAALRIMAPHGRYAFYAAGKGSKPEVTLDAQALYARSQTIAGVTSLTTPAEDMASMLKQMTKMFEDGSLQAPTDSELIRVSIEEGPGAYAEAIKTAGKKYVIMFD